MKFTLAKYETLIELVRANPCLYDASLVYNKDNSFKKDAWTSIAIQMNEPAMTGYDWKKVWKQKRDSFVRKRREIENCSIESAAQIASKFPLYDQMTFLVETIPGRSIISNFEQSSQPSISDGLIGTDTNFSDDVENATINESEPSVFFSSWQNPSPTATSTAVTTTPRPMKRKASSPIDLLIEKLNQQPYPIGNSMPTHATGGDTREPIENHNILSFLSSKMNNFRPSTQLWMENEVIKIYVEAKRRDSEKMSPLPASYHHGDRTMKAVRFTPGEPKNLFISDKESIPEPKEKEVQIRIVATAINRADTLQRKGNYAPPPGASDILGLEAAGFIEKVGSGCPESVQKGQRVMALLAGGGNAEYVTCRHEQLIPVPDNLSLTQAAAIPEVWLTAYQLLYFIGKLSFNDTVLIHAGASGVGTAAVQLVKQAGATAIVTAGSQKKIDLALLLGAVAGVNYKEGNVGDKVLEITEGKGVNLILDCVGASLYEENLKAISLDGRWVLYGLMGGAEVKANLGVHLRKRIAFSSTTLRLRSIEYKESLVREFSSRALPLFASGAFKPVIDRVLPLSEIVQAHTTMEANENTGKIVLKVSEEEDLLKVKDEL